MERKRRIHFSLTLASLFLSLMMIEFRGSFENPEIIVGVAKVILILVTMSLLYILINFNKYIKPKKVAS